MVTLQSGSPVPDDHSGNPTLGLVTSSAAEDGLPVFVTLPGRRARDGLVFRGPGERAETCRVEGFDVAAMTGHLITGRWPLAPG